MLQVKVLPGNNRKERSGRTGKPQTRLIVIDAKTKRLVTSTTAPHEATPESLFLAVNRISAKLEAKGYPPIKWEDVPHA